jgi:phosphatidylserine/phosphatidylglycerophosphate/cardiolipin synthase-like enzyme
MGAMEARNFRIAVVLIVSLGLLMLAASVLQTLAAPRDPRDSLDVVISEIAWMGTTTSSVDEWIELYNNTAITVDLTGWTLAAGDGTPVITLTGIISPTGHFLLERTDDNSTPGVPADQIYTGALGNDGEDLVLRDDASAVIDQVNCSGGWFAGHADGRVPMVRVNTTVTGSQASNWTYNPRCGTATNSAGISRTCTLTVTNISHALDYAVYFNERFTATSTTTETTLIEDALLSLIDGATTSVDIALYGLNRQSVITALINAHGRGVTVRVVGDDEAATGDYTTGYQALTDAGITVITDTSTSKIQHNKFLVVDGQVVWTGSTNFTDTGLTLNANNSVIITDTTLAAIYTAEFEEMWTGDFHEDKADDTAHLLDYNGMLLESYFSPTDLVAFEVWEELVGADESIHFGMFFWTDDLLTNRVVKRLGAGVEVYGVWDALGAASPYSADEALSGAGAQIRVENFAGKVHHKFAVIDVEGSDPVVILGSYNWTDSGAYDNDENTLIVHDYKLAQAYYNEWQRLWWALEPEAPGVEVGPDHTYQVDAGQTVIYDHVLTNTGTTTDTFLLEFVSHKHWPTELLEDVYPTGTLKIGSQMTTSFQVSLTVPADANGTEITVITATSQLSPAIWDTATDTTIVTYRVYLPLILKRWPPIPYKPTLNPISNNGSGNYVVSWTEQPSRLSDTYTLQEATDAAFIKGREVCTTAQQSCSVSVKEPGTYYYRVRGYNDSGYGAWSNVQAATVSPPTATHTPTPTQPPTPTDTPEPTNTPTPTNTPQPGTTGDIRITYIYYDGAGSQEPDEYVRIQNYDSRSIQMDSWTLRDEANHVFTFPNYLMEPGQVCRIYTNEDHPEWCGFNYGSGSAIWNNGGDCAELRNSTGTTIDTYCY